MRLPRFIRDWHLKRTWLEPNLAARKQARANGQIYVSSYTRKA